MALTLTGASADSYQDVSDADAYATNHFIGTDLTAWNAATTANKEAALRQSTQFIDAKFRDRFPGQIRSESQALEWPRVNARDRAGRVLNQVPDIIKAATVELAKERLVAGGNLVASEARGGQVKRVKVGPIEQEFMDRAPAGTVYRWVEQLISKVLTNVSHRAVRS